jgi:hypothetical protein
MSAPKRRNWIARQFAARPIEMLEGSAMRVLTLAERRALDRIEIEYAHHGGTDNGKLPITYMDFEHFGLHPNAIAPSLRALVALGFVEITRKGYGGAAGVRAPSLYRSRIVLPGTLHAEMETVRTITSRSRRSKRRKPLLGERGAVLIPATSSGRRRAGKIQNATLTFRAISPSENEGETRNPRPHISRVQAHPRKMRVLSKVSGGGGQSA